MGIAKEWDEAKKAMEKVRVDVKVFSKDFGSALKDFEKADAKYDDASGKYPEKVAQLRADRKSKKDKAYPIAAKYGELIRSLHDHATDPKQKVGLDIAYMKLVNIIHLLDHVR